MTELNGWEISDIENPPKGMSWVRSVVEVRKNDTGEIREFVNDYELLEIGDSAPSTFMWADGNYSCDCNRALFFLRAGEEDDSEDETPCGDGAYSVRVRNKLSGKVIYDEITHHQSAEPVPVPSPTSPNNPPDSTATKTQPPAQSPATTGK